jgi:hypothetical protein
VGATFLSTFYDVESGRFRRSDADAPEACYWRAADQVAVGCLWLP